MSTPRNIKSGAAAVLLALACAGTAQAASVSYFLDQSDKLTDGVNYLKVTISDGDNGAVNFQVDTLAPLLDNYGENSNFGIVKFAFNAVPGIPLGLSNVDISSLPYGWVTGQHQDMDGFGNYDMRLRITDAHTPRSPSISFSVNGIDFDTLASYVDLALNSTEGPSLFSARVGGLNLPCARSDWSCNNGDAFFGGPASPIPAPPAIWLLGTAVAGLVGRRFRKAATPAA